jgi:MFS superfamily sulfate permease-like transporter
MNNIDFMMLAGGIGILFVMMLVGVAVGIIVGFTLLIHDVLNFTKRRGR